MGKPLKIGVVGACGTGKSELVARLLEYGYQARHIAQEHSFAPMMWQKSSNPDFLVYLTISFPVTLQRKKFNWTEAEFQEQLYRLRHAKDHADLIIDTDHLTPDDVFQIVLHELGDKK
jgi:hypothetical protein